MIWNRQLLKIDIMMMMMIIIIIVIILIFCENEGKEKNCIVRKQGNANALGGHSTHNCCKLLLLLLLLF